MKKILNPFKGIDGYCCFGCAPDNENGLRMEFFEDGDDIVSYWEPEDHFQGYNYILHGGVRASLIDELAAWVVFVKMGTSGYTTRLDVKYSLPVYTNKGKVMLRGRLAETSRNIAFIDVEIFDHDGKIATTGRAEYFTLPERIARGRMLYPGADSFFGG